MKNSAKNSAKNYGKNYGKNCSPFHTLHFYWSSPGFWNGRGTARFACSDAKVLSAATEVGAGI